MILWSIKLFTTFRRAIAGRKYPHQLAWAVAFGLLLGIIPHGNLLAIMLLVVVLSLKLNHAAAGLTAIGVSFLATRLDPVSHRLGEYALTNPRYAEFVQDAWTVPMVPWTDLNNTVVLGSFLIGSAALLPVFAITYPVFRAFRPREEVVLEEPIEPKPTEQTSDTHPVAIIDRRHAGVPAPNGPERPTRSPSTKETAPTANMNDRIDFHEIDESSEAENRVAVETRIDVIRVKESSTSSGTDAETRSTTQHLTETKPSSGKLDEAKPMDEALNYLLRQLRDSQQRNAA